MSLNIDESTQRIIAELVLEAIQAAVRKESGHNPSELESLAAQHRLLGRPSGAFVTIYVDHQLRGCLGEVTPDDALIQVLLRCASRVPVCDYRFSPVQVDELDRLTFKVSILSPPTALEDVDSIVIGRDGLIVRHGGQSGLLLPEVPVEYHWDVPTFLNHLWLKAGIDTDIPLSEVRLWRFSSQIIPGELLNRVRT